MNLLIVTLFLTQFIIPGELLESNNNYCLSKDDNPHLYFGTITSYNNIRMKDSSATVSGCKPKQIWLFTRHGTRHNLEFDSSKSVIELQQQIVQNHAAGRVKLCDEDFQALSKWSWDSSIDNHEGELTEEGRNELYQLGKRYKMKYPDLMNIGYDANQFYFRPANSSRIIESCQQFVKGLFENENVVIDKPRKDDLEIRAFASCKEWSERLEKGNAMKIQLKALTESFQFQKMIQDISERLGFETKLNINNTLAMYENCRFEKTRAPAKFSAWCSVFTKPELMLLEYYQDIIMYYVFSYGYENNPKLGCFSLRHMMQAFEKTVQNDEAEPKTIGLFSHDAALDMILSALNYAKDSQPLTGTDYEDLLINRKYRSWHVGFASNIAAVLHDCQPDNERYKVQFFLNERPMELEGCPDGLCTWTYLQQFLSFTKTCSMEFCNNSATTGQFTDQSILG